MSLIHEIKAYLEPEPHTAVSNLKHPQRNSCDNSLLFSATLMAMLPPSDREIMRPWFFKIVGACEIEPGLYKRHPDNADFNSHDDLTGVAIGGWLAGFSFPKDILSYGRRHFYSWNTEQPGKFTWRGFLPRILDFIPAVRASAGVPLTKFDYWCVLLSLIANRSEPQGETSGRCLMFLKHLALYGKRKDMDQAIDEWRKSMYELYPNGMRDVYAIYFGSDHPLTKYAWTNFGEGFKA